MALKISLDNRGRTWMCRSCKTIFFIPENALEQQKKIGCLNCGKRLWKNIPYTFLFIKQSEILRANSHDFEQNTSKQGVDTSLSKNTTFSSFNTPECAYLAPSADTQTKLQEGGK
jgi:DNA-directed RNA polymerase subunit RPC12/RpoP